jgi:hypothetical protein
MPHFPKPFWGPKKGRWYVQLDGKHVNLGADQADAFRRYYDLMGKQPIPIIPTAADPPLVSVLDAFLDWCLKHQDMRIYESYKERI